MRSTFIIAAALAFCAAATAQPLPGTPATEPCATCGVVDSVRYVEKKGQGSGAGLVAGGIVGGVLGHQIGSGRGNTAATILGAGAPNGPASPRNAGPFYLAPGAVGAGVTPALGLAAGTGTLRAAASRGMTCRASGTTPDGVAGARLGRTAGTTG